MSTKFLLVRHGETFSSRERRFAGSTDTELTDDGRAQAEALARRLRQVRVDVLYSSPLSRCRQTAEAITHVTGRKPTVDDRIRECHFGEWEDLTVTEIMDRRRDEFMHWLSDETVAPAGGESWAQVGERLRDWFEDAGRRYEDRTVLAITHGGPILWLARHVTHAPYQAMVAFEIDTCSITVIQSRRGLWRLRHLNDTSHIRDPLLEGPPPKPMPP